MRGIRVASLLAMGACAAAFGMSSARAGSVLTERMLDQVTAGVSISAGAAAAAATSVSSMIPITVTSAVTNTTASSPASGVEFAYGSGTSFAIGQYTAADANVTPTGGNPIAVSIAVHTPHVSAAVAGGVTASVH